MTLGQIQRTYLGFERLMIFLVSLRGFLVGVCSTERARVRKCPCPDWVVFMMGLAGRAGNMWAGICYLSNHVYELREGLFAASFRDVISSKDLVKSSGSGFMNRMGALSYTYTVYALEGRQAQRLKSP